MDFGRDFAKIYFLSAPWLWLTITLCFFALVVVAAHSHILMCADGAMFALSYVLEQSWRWFALATPSRLTDYLVSSIGPWLVMPWTNEWKPIILAYSYSYLLSPLLFLTLTYLALCKEDRHHLMAPIILFWAGAMQSFGFPHGGAYFFSILAFSCQFFLVLPENKSLFARFLQAILISSMSLTYDTSFLLIPLYVYFAFSNWQSTKEIRFYIWGVFIAAYSVAAVLRFFVTSPNEMMHFALADNFRVIIGTLDQPNLYSYCMYILAFLALSPARQSIRPVVPTTLTRTLFMIAVSIIFACALFMNTGLEAHYNARAYGIIFIPLVLMGYHRVRNMNGPLPFDIRVVLCFIVVLQTIHNGALLYRWDKYKVNVLSVAQKDSREVFHPGHFLVAESGFLFNWVTPFQSIVIQKLTNDKVKALIRDTGWYSPIPAEDLEMLERNLLLDGVTPSIARQLRLHLDRRNKRWRNKRMSYS